MSFYKMDRLVRYDLREDVVMGSPYRRLDESHIEEAIRVSGEKNLKDTIASALNGWRDRGVDDLVDYDGLFLHEQDGSKFLVASPERFLRNAGIFALEIGSSAPVFVHASQEVEVEMDQLKKRDIGRFTFIGTTSASVDIISATRHEGVRVLCDNLSCRQVGDTGILVPYFYQGGYYLGPRRVVSTVYRIDSRILSEVKSGEVHTRKVEVEDIDNQGSILLSLQEATGRELRTGNYRGADDQYYVVSILPKYPEQFPDARDESMSMFDYTSARRLF